VISPKIFEARVSTAPEVRDMVAYWRSIHPQGGGLPGWQHFEPLDVPRLLPGIWLLDVAGEPPRFRCRLLGTAVVWALGFDITGRYLDEALPEYPGSEAERMDLAVVADRQPRWRRGPPTMHTDRYLAELEVVTLPLARDGYTVDILLNYTHYGRKGRDAGLR